jgi:hypothetical protein
MVPKMKVLEGIIEPTFLSAATLVAAHYGFTCPPRFMSVWCLVLGWTEIAISQLCAVRLGLNLVETSGWYSRLVCMLVSRFDCFSYCKHTKEQQNRENRDFRKFEISPPFQLRLI